MTKKVDRMSKKVVEKRENRGSQNAKIGVSESLKISRKEQNFPKKSQKTRFWATGVDIYLYHPQKPAFLAIFNENFAFPDDF